VATIFYFASAELASPTIADGTYFNQTSVLHTPAPIIATGQGNLYRKKFATTMVTSQKNITLVNSITEFRGMFFGRFQSDPLAAQTIPAQTWNFGINCGEGVTSANTFHWPYLAIYRPSTGQIVFTFLDGTSSAGGVEWSGGQTAGVPNNYACPSFTCQDGDVLIYEAWAALQTAAAAVPSMPGTHLWAIDDTSSKITSPHTFTFYTGPVGANTPSTADTLAYEPMVPMATADRAVLSSVASPMAYAPMAPSANTTATITRAPVLTTSVADPMAYAPMAPTSATAVVSKTYTSVASPPVYSLAPAASKDHVASRASSLAYEPMVPVDAVSTVVIGVVSHTSTALPAAYLATATPATVVRQAYSTATPYTYSVTPAAAVATAARVLISSGDAAVYAPMVPTPASVNVTSAASPATFAVAASSIDVFFSGTTSLFPIAHASNVVVGARRASAAALLAPTHTATGTGTDSSGPSVDGVLSSFWGGAGNINDRFVDLAANTSQQTQYFGRFISRPLAAQTIHAQTWNWAFVVAATNLDANTYLWPVMYVYRPSNNTVVGHIFDAAGPAGAVWPAAIAAAPTRNLTGARVDAEEGDVLVIECYAGSTSSTGIARRQTWRMTANTSRVISQYKILYKPTSTLWFTSSTAPVAPTAGKKASSLPLAITNSAATIATEYLWSETAPNDTQQTARSSASQSNTAAPQSYYIGRFTTPALAAQTIPAQTWSYEVSTASSSVNANTYFWPVMYVWRPSTNQVVSPYIFNASGPVGNKWLVSDDPRLDQQFAGAAVNVLDGDVLVVEIWGAGQQTTTGGTYQQRMWTNSFNSRIVSPYKLQYYTGLKQSIQSSADAAAYALAAADATSSTRQLVQSVAEPAVCALAAVDATSVLGIFLPLISTLTENFEAPLNTDKWTTSGVNGSVTVSDGVANFAVTNGITGAKCNLTSKNFFDLRGTRVFAKVVQPLRQTGDPPNNSYSVGVKSAGENYVAWAFNTAGILAIHKFTNDAWDGELAQIATGIYATPDTFRWLAVRENAGTIYFESAPGTASNPPTEGQWVVRHSVLASTLSLDPSACQLIAWIYIGLGATTTAPFQIDAVNTATAPAAAITSTALPTTYTLTAANATGIKAAVVQSSALPATYALAAVDATGVRVGLGRPLIGTLTENFEAAPDVNKWILAGTNGTVTFTGGVANFAVTNGISGAKCSIESKELFDLRESRVFAKVVQPWRLVGDPAANTFQVGLHSAGGNYIQWAVNTAGAIELHKFTNDAWGYVADIVAAPAGFTDTYKWLAISERAGITYFESAPATASNPPTEGQWVVRYSAPTNTLPIDASACQFITWIYVNAGGTTSLPLQIDAVNTSTSVIGAAITSVADPLAFAPMVAFDATSTVTRQTVSNALTAGYILAPAALTTVNRGYTSTASSTTYNLLSGVGSTDTLNRVTNAVPGSFSQALATSTVDLAGYNSQAGPVTYTYSPTAATVSVFIAPVDVPSVALPVVFTLAPQSTTVSLGRVYTSNAVPASFSHVSPDTGFNFGRIAVALPSAYSSARAPAVSTWTATSAALPALYAAAAQSTTVYLGRVYTSNAVAAGFTVTAYDTGTAGLPISSAVPSAYSLAAAAAVSSVARPSVALQANYAYTAQSATASLGRVFTSVATGTSFFFNGTIEPWPFFARVSSASAAAYSLAGTVATSGSLRSTFSNALEATYSYAGLSATGSVVLAGAGAATQATYTSIARESYGYASRASVALPLTFVGVAGTVTSSRTDRVSYAFPFEFVIEAFPTNIAGAALIRYTSIAEPTTYLLSGAWGHDAHSRKVNGFPPVYSTTPTAATSVPTKNSIAVAAGYLMYMPDVRSGRDTFSVALPTSYSVATPATYVPNKYVSAALPPSYSVVRPATGSQRGRASKANPATYVFGLWPTFEYIPSLIKPPLVFPQPVLKPVITDAQFANWLEDEHAIRVVLIETRCIESVSGSIELVYFASHGFVTKVEDGPPIYYAPLMRGGLDFAQSLDINLSGNYSYGDIELDNSDGDLDWMFDRVWQFKELKAYVGDATWPRRDFRQIFDGTIEDVDSSQRDTVNMRIRDKLYRLDSPLHELTIGGFGPNADRLAPVALGECHNITPILQSVNNLIYAYHVRVGEGAFEVRDNGIPIAITLLQGAPASFKLNKQPYGRITCSVQGDKVVATNGYLNTVAELVRRLMKEWGTEKENRFVESDIDMINFTEFDALNKYPVGLWATERLTVLEACQQLAASVGARLTMTALGKAQLVKLQLPPVSTGPVNLVYNGDFIMGLDTWAVANYGIGVSISGTNLDASWTLIEPGTSTFYAGQDGCVNNQSAYYEYSGRQIPAIQDATYTIGAYTGAHRCKVEILFHEYDEYGNKLGSSISVPAQSTNVAEKNGGTALSGYKYIYSSKKLQSGVAYIKPVLRKYDTFSPTDVNSYLFATKVRVEREGSGVVIPIEVTESDMVLGSLHIADRLPVVAGCRLGYCKNWTVQEDTASGVPEDHKSMYAREWLTVLVTDSLVKEKYGLWSEPEQENCLLIDSDSATVECNRRVRLRSEQRHVYEFVGFANLMFTPVGAAMRIKHHRFGLSAGKVGQVISVSVNWLTSHVTIKVLI